MARKDPAALMYISNFLTTTAHMKGDEAGWYIRLIMHHYDKGYLPNSIEELASLAHVRFTEYARFEQAFEQVLKHLFKLTMNEDLNRGVYINIETVDILQAREDFKEKKSDAGKMSWFIRYLEKHFTKDQNLLNYIKKNTDVSEFVDQNNKLFEQVFEQVFKQKSELYINTITNKDTDTISVINFPKKETAAENLVSADIATFKTSFDNDYLIDQTVVQANGFNPEQLAIARSEFWNEKQFDKEMLGKGYQDVQVHFIRYCKQHSKRIKEIKPGGGNNTGASETAKNWN